MARRRSRWLSLATTLALVASLIPVGVAAGAVDTGGGAGRVPVMESSVDTHVTSKGVLVRFRNLARDVLSVDVYRSEAAGVEGEKVNDEPVKGSSFLDTSAKPGVQYFYTVKVVERSGEADPNLKTASVLPQVKSDVQKKDSTNEKKKAEKRDNKLAELPSPSTAGIGKASTISGAAMQLGVSGPTTLTANTTWSPANGPYFIRNDLVVPKGVTLTILPGTEVYFDTVMSGIGSADTSANPTAGVDLIVRGKLVAKGTAASRILMTSVRSTAASATSDALPQRGDWGAIYTDSRSASEIAYTDISYAFAGVIADRTTRPYINHVTVRDGIIGILFMNPVGDAASPRPRITNSNVVGCFNGIWVHWYMSAGDGRGLKVLDPYIVQNRVSAYFPLSIQVVNSEPEAVSGGTILAGEIRNNTITSNVGDGAVVGVESYGADDVEILTQFSGNTIESRDNVALTCWAIARETGTARIKPTLSGDKLNGYHGAFYADAWNAGSEQTDNKGGAYANPAFVNSQLRADAGDAIELCADANGAGTASTTFTFSGGTALSSESYGVYTDTDSEYGIAACSPQISNSTIEVPNGYDAIFIDVESEGSGESRAHPIVSNSRIISRDDEAIEIYVDSAGGHARSKPQVSGSKIVGYYDGLYVRAYASEDMAGNGVAETSPKITGSSIKSTYGDAMDVLAESWGVGSPAVSSPSVIDSSLISASDSDGCGVYVDANSWDGPVSATGLYDGSYIRGGHSAMYYDIDAYDSTESRDVECSPVITDCEVESAESSAVFLGVWNNVPGAANVRPVMTDVRISASEGAGVYLYAYKADRAGATTVSPRMTRVDAAADEEALYVEVSGPAAALTVGGTYKDCSFVSAEYCAVEIDAGGEADTSRATVAPKFYDCDVEAMDGYGYDIYGSASGDDSALAVVRPVVDGGVAESAYGIYISAYSGNGIGAENLQCAGTVRDALIYSSWGDGVYTEAYTVGAGDVTNEFVAYNNTVRAWGAAASHSATAVYSGWEGSGSGKAVNKSVTAGISATVPCRLTSFSDNAVYTEASSYSGDAEDRSVVRYVVMEADDAGYSGTARAEDGVATAAQVVLGNKVDRGVHTETCGAAIDAYGARTFVTPSISGNSFNYTASDGLYISTGAETTATISPTITGNTIRYTSGNGISLSFDAWYGAYGAGRMMSAGGAVVDPASKALITKNKITKPSLCNIFFNDVPYARVEQNQMAYPGWDYENNDEYNTSCIYWDGVDSSSVIRGNMLRGARSAALYFEGGEAPQVVWNSFGDCDGVVNRPFNYWTDADTTPTVRFDARYNWWGTKSATGLAKTIYAPAYDGPVSDYVNYSSALKTCAPTVTSMTVKKSGSTRTFKVTFDRPMDKSITKLYFGAKSPYKTYSIKGSWSSNGRVFTGKYKGTLPTGKTLRLHGATDLPGNAMAKKAFKL